KSSASKKPERQIPTGHRFSNKKTTTVPKKTMNLRSCLRWQLTSRILKTIGLRNQCQNGFTKVEIFKETSVANDTSGLVPQRQKASDYDNPGPAPELQNVSSSADTTVPSQQELDLLFGPLYDEFFNDGTSRVNKSSSPTDNSAPQDTYPSTNIHSTS
ncbi:hypothetical protein Tco_0055686, partial [Tanacetum coccineum]